MNITDRTNAQSRLDAIDIAKGLGMILVVFFHVNYSKNPEILAYSFHMPLFFMISGMLFDKERHPTFVAFLKRRVRTLICPYVLFYALSVLLEFGIDLLSNSLNWQAYGSYFLQMFLSQGSAKVVYPPLWFVLCLFAVELMYYFVSKLDKKYIIPICLALTTLGWLLESGLLPFDNTLLPWSLDSALFSLGFYALGNLLFPTAKKALLSLSDHKHKIWITLGIVLLCMVIGTPLALWNGKVSLGSKVLSNGFLFYATGVIGTVGVLALSVLLAKIRFLTWMGKNSFCIMALHYPVRRCVHKVYALCGISRYNDRSLLQSFLPFVIIFALTILATAIYCRIKRAISERRDHRTATRA